MQHGKLFFTCVPIFFFTSFGLARIGPHKEREIRLAGGTLISHFYLARFKLRLLAKEGVTGRYKQQEEEDGVNRRRHVLCFLARCSLLKIYGVGLSLSGRKEIQNNMHLLFTEQSLSLNKFSDSSE